MNHKNVAADILFSGSDRDGINTLDNAIRGHYIEALIWALLKEHNKTRPSDSQWINAGVGWGPWDLQRGRHDAGNRVRIQVKIKADKQLWKPQKIGRPKFSLGWNDKEPPKFFASDFDPSIYGGIEPPPSHRCDLFLLGWHGKRPDQTERRHSNQANPGEYDFLIAAVTDLLPAATSLPVSSDVFERFGKPEGAGQWSYQELPKALDAAADEYLRSRSSKPSSIAIQQPYEGPMGDV